MRATRLFAGVGVCAVIALVASPLAHGDDVTVPVELQVQLLGRVARYERRFAARSESAHVLVVSQPRQAESQRVASQIVAAIARTGQLGGRAVAVSRHEYAGQAALWAEVDRTHASIVYFTGGLGADMVAITAAGGGRSVITVSAVGSDVDHGAVLGFELVSSRPQIAVNLGRARTQQLEFSAQFLRLARVVR